MGESDGWGFDRENIASFREMIKRTRIYCNDLHV